MELGFIINDVKQLKLKHVTELIKSWKEQNISIGEMKNRMSHLRWIAEKIGKPMMIPKRNIDLGIENRVMPPNNVNRAVERSEEDLNKIRDVNVRFALQAQALFGLRRKEAILFNPKRDYDAEKRVIYLETGTKGGRPRIIPVLKQDQIDFLTEMTKYQHDFGLTAFIPRDKKYKDQLQVYKSECDREKFSNNHGLRHKYAQKRFLELTGFEPPRNGGKTRKELNPKERELDSIARLKISNELGHGREEITRVYLGV